MPSRSSRARALIPFALLGLAGCARSAAVQTGPSLPLRRVVVYRNGVGYFEREGRVQASEVQFHVTQREVDDFLATLAVMERGGSSVRAAAFPLPETRADGTEPPADARRTVRLALDGADHDLRVGYTVETPIWRPTYRLVFGADREHAEVQAWGIVQNVSGEDWSSVRLSLVAGAPVSFRSELSRATVPTRPVVTDQGAVIDAVPVSDTTLAEQPAAAEPAPGLGAVGTGMGGGGLGEGTIGLGDIGTMGHGAGTGSGQGYGSGAGRGLRGRGGSGPTVRASPPTVSGSLSVEAVRRVVLRNLGQVSFCFEQGLASHPNDGGRVVVRFVIGQGGAVVASSPASSTLATPSVAPCIANAVRRWQFPTPEGGGVVAVTYPFTLNAGDAGERDGAGAADDTPRFEAANGQPAPTSTPRNVRALAALATQGGVTRYDLPQAVTIPDRSATMVLLTSRDVPGSQRFLFAPDPGVGDSASHPFRVARFENRTGGLLERGPVAIFESGAFLGQGMLDPLPDGATTTVPFALERGVAVESSSTSAVEGARLVAMHRGTLTLERFTVRRTTYRVRNGLDTEARVLLRHDLGGAELFEPPTGTEATNGRALVPLNVAARGHAELVVTTRAPWTASVDLSDEQAVPALEQYLREGHPDAALAQAVRSAIDLRTQSDALQRDRDAVSQRRDDLEQSTQETRENLLAIQRNGQAADLRAQLTARLARASTELDQLTRRVVELDTQLSEKRVRLIETVRTVDFDAAAAPSPASAHPAP